MKTNIITGFHAIEETVKSQSENKNIDNTENTTKIFYSKAGPRVKKILELAKKANIPCEKKTDRELNALVKNLPERLREHRGIVLSGKTPTRLSIDTLMAEFADKKSAFFVLLDSITDPHNIGSIIRSADQLGVDAVILPERNSAGGYEVIAKISSGASAWVPVIYVKNLIRVAQMLKREGFWIYGADGNGEDVHSINFAEKTVLVMGSEGKGIAQHLKDTCDKIVSIPTQGRLDSLNVSVAAGILFYEISRR
ncbi:MAG: 23S rRNA (guanosine(2251)-2'-O)-methyltransferase RlmB [Treponema sp.]|nr:MAG: 23S rRNA (guanosine(2251)-2'-O)-methyltransferase RlmB [Treponema sp.]